MAICKRAHIPKPVIPLPTKNNRWILVNKVIKPKWRDGDILPTHLVNILDKEIETENDHRPGDGSIDHTKILPFMFSCPSKNGKQFVDIINEVAQNRSCVRVYSALTYLILKNA